MHIEINPKSLQNLEHIVQILYKLHPKVLNYLVNMERTLGKVLGCLEKDNKSLEEREFLTKINEDIDINKPVEILKFSDLFYEDILETKDLKLLTKEDKRELALSRTKDVLRKTKFNNLLRYLQLDTDEYIPIKIYIEVEDPINGRKVKELVRALENTRAPEQFYLNKMEMDEYAYFAEGYRLKLNDEQQRKKDEIHWGRNIDVLKEILLKEKLYEENMCTDI